MIFKYIIYLVLKKLILSSLGKQSLGCFSNPQETEFDRAGNVLALPIV